MPRELKILALDLATTTGWAHTCGKSGVENFALIRGETPGLKWLKFEAWLDELVAEWPVDVIAYEQAHHRGGAATHSAHAFISSVEKIAANLKLDLTNRHTSQIKAHAIKGKKRKRCKVSMVRAAMRRWPDLHIIDDNHADALFLLDLVCKDLGVGE